MSFNGNYDEKVVSIESRRARNSVQFHGSISAPAIAPQLGFIQTLQALQDLGYLHSGDSLVSAMHRAGVVLPDQQSRTFAIMPHGVFARSQVGIEAKILLDAMAEEGFEGSVTYSVEGSEQQLHLMGGRMTSSEDIASMKLA